MPQYNRKTTPKVKGGAVQKKNRHGLTPNYWNTPQNVPAIDKERPGPGHKHYLKKNHIIDFISILPEWEEISKGLDAVLLAQSEDGAEGWYAEGVVGICAWSRDLWQDTDIDYYNDHKEIFDKLGVESEPKKGFILCKFTESKIRAYQLLHLFLHELGHHHDRMTTKNKINMGRGDSYAEKYARKYEEIIWNRYVESFGIE
jgi:hypothetical protein